MGEGPCIQVEEQTPGDRGQSPRSVLLSDTRREPGTNYAIQRESVHLSHEGETTVGRADRTADFVPDVDLSSVDPERSLSRRHARVVKGDAGFYLVGELGARNGTLVNGQRLDPAMPVRIDDGDEIQFGLVRVQFRSR